MEYDMNEALLDSWLNMYVSIRGNRIVSVLRFNEILICNILYRQQQEGKELLTATDLCDRTKLLKSQINKLLSSLEKKEIIERFRSESDKRRVFIRLNPSQISIYLEEHAQIVKILETLNQAMGAAKIKELTSLLKEATQIITEIKQ